MRQKVSRLVPLLCCAVLLLGLLPRTARGAGLTVDLTEEERRYVEGHGPLRVGYVQDRVPVSFLDEDGELAGISRYIFDRIEALSGLEFEYVPLPVGPVTYEYLIGQELDLVTSVEYNEANRNANGILISMPYLSSRKVVVARKDLDFRTDAALSVAVPTGSQTLKSVLAQTFPAFTLLDFDSVADCLEAVDAGEADLLIQNQYMAEYWRSKPAYEDLKVIPVMGLEDQICFSAVVAFGDWEGPSAQDGQVLIGILDKAIALLSEDEVASYVIRAVMENPYVFTLGDFLYRYRYAAGALGALLLAVLVLALLLSRQRMRYLADRADAKARGQFLSTMSHEIRTPLNGLIGLNYLMSQSVGDREKLEVYLRQSNATAQYLLTLVNDILDMSQFQEHRLRLVSRPVDLQMLFSTVTAIVRGGMAEKDIDFRADVELPWPCVTGDEARIQQVVLNLLDNARKFTQEGGRVDLTVRQSRDRDGAVRTAVTVADNGRGMSKEFQQHIFETFAQELDTVSKGNQGTGLGLPISLALSRLMGGGLTFSSRKGEGSTFDFTFVGPAAQMPAPAEAEDAPERPKPGILVAEDNELNGEIVVELLEAEGFPVSLARDGAEALRLFRESAPGTYGAILMDLLMPNMDGFEASRAIRGLDRPDAKSVYIIACSANAISEEQDKIRQSRIDDFLPKPIDIGALLEKIGIGRPC